MVPQCLNVTEERWHKQDLLYTVKPVLYSKICVKNPLSKDQKLVFKTNYRLMHVRKYCRMHSAILSTFIKLPFVIKVFVLSTFEWQFYTGFTVQSNETQENIVYNVYLKKLYFTCENVKSCISHENFFIIIIPTLF